jgi:hypothetical protein
MILWRWNKNFYKKSIFRNFCYIAWEMEGFNFGGESVPTSNGEPEYGGGVEDVVSVFRRTHQKNLEEQAKRVREEHDKQRAAAREEIEKFFAERRAKKEVTAKENRANQEHAKNELESSGEADSWARVVQLVDLNAPRPEGSRDVSRMRHIFLEAKHGTLLRSSH